MESRNFEAPVKVAKVKLVDILVIWVMNMSTASARRPEGHNLVLSEGWNVCMFRMYAEIVLHRRLLAIIILQKIIILLCN